MVHKTILADVYCGWFFQLAVDYLLLGASPMELRSQGGLGLRASRAAHW